MSKSRDIKQRRQRANRKLEEWRKQRNNTPHDISAPIEIVAVKGKLPAAKGK